jgi:hypothetical protein
MEIMVRTRWSIAVAYCIGIGFLIYILFPQWSYDDPYITYRYAENIHNNLGFVYNSGERILSTTTPFFTLLLAILNNISSNIPKVAILIGTISLPLGGLFLWDLGHTWDTPAAGWLGLVFYPTFPLLISTISSEVPLYMFFCVGSFAWYARKRYVWTTIFLAFAILTRPEGAIIALILITHYLVQIRGPILRPVIGMFLLITLPWFLFSSVYFGSLIPATLGAKQYHGAMEISQGFGPGIITILSGGYTTRVHYWIAASLAMIGLFSIPRRYNQWVIFIIWPVVHFGLFTILGVSRYFWYYASLIPGFLVAAGLGIDHLNFLIKPNSFLPQRITKIIAYTFTIGILISQFTHVLAVRQHPDQRVQIYQTIGRWLQSNTEHNSSVGSLEVGIIGFYSKRTIVDLAGIIQPEIAQQLTPNATYEVSAIWATQTYKPDYLILNPTWFPKLMDDFVDPYCQVQENFPGESFGYKEALSIYHCDWPESII